MKKLLLPFFLIGTIVMIFVMAKTGATLKPATAHGILDLEFAYNTTKTADVLKAWAPVNGFDNIVVAKTNTYYDFLFLFFYSGFLFLACKKIASKTGGGFSKTGNIVAQAALVAGFLDILENIGMLLTLSNQGSLAIALCTTIVSLIKWLLAIMAVLYLLIGLLALAFRKS
jgi:hypothetical protein